MNTRKPADTAGSQSSGSCPPDERTALFQDVPVGLGMVDRELVVLHINDVLAELNGGTVEWHLGRTLDEILPGQLARQFSENCRKVLNSDQPVIEQECRRHAPGDPHREDRFWQVSYKPFHAGAGEITGVSLVVRDITERRRHQLEVQRRMAFEKLIADLSARFVNTPAAEVDGVILDALRQVAEFHDFDRVGFGKYIEDGTVIKSTHSWARKGIEPFPDVVLNEMLPYLSSVLGRREVYRHENVGSLPESAVEEREYARRKGIKSNVIIPLTVGGTMVGGIGVDSFRSERTWPDELVDRIRLMGEILINATARQIREEEIERLKSQLKSENLYLREEIELELGHENVVATSRAMREVLRQVDQVARTDSTVLLTGETGTGKEVVAHTIHERSDRRDRVMVKVNCAALPSPLVESELFGREKGAYTNALSRQAGRFEVADGSTLFLDEVGELPAELQTKLLRVLQEGEFERLGSPKTIRVNVRVIAATNRDLAKDVRDGRFREDLFYRLNVFPIDIAPLRERWEDIPPLVWKFVTELAEKMGKNIETIPRRTMDRLTGYPWPGNVRELKNVIERALIVSSGTTLEAEVPRLEETGGTPEITLEELDRRHITDVLKKTEWRVRGAGGAALILGLKPTTLEAKMRKLGIRRPV